MDCRCAFVAPRRWAESAWAGCREETDFPGLPPEDECQARVPGGQAGLRYLCRTDTDDCLREAAPGPRALRRRPPSGPREHRPRLARGRAGDPPDQNLRGLPEVHAAVLQSGGGGRNGRGGPWGGGGTGREDGGGQQVSPRIVPRRRVRGVENGTRQAQERSGGGKGEEERESGREAEEERGEKGKTGGEEEGEGRGRGRGRLCSSGCSSGSSSSASSSGDVAGKSTATGGDRAGTSSGRPAHRGRRAGGGRGDSEDDGGPDNTGPEGQKASVKEKLAGTVWRPLKYGGYQERLWKTFTQKAQENFYLKSVENSLFLESKMTLETVCEFEGGLYYFDCDFDYCCFVSEKWSSALKILSDSNGKLEGVWKRAGKPYENNGEDEFDLDHDDR